MRIYNRQFDESQKDYQKMWTFLVDDYADKQDHFIWTIGRLGEWPNSLSYGYGRFFPSYMRNNAQLWFNSFEELVSFSISENGTGDFYVLTRRGHEFLYQEMIEWVMLNWSEKAGGLVTHVDESQIVFMQALERSGFHKGEIDEVSRQYDLQNMDNQKLSLPEGVIIKICLHIQTQSEVSLLVKMRGTIEMRSLITISQDIISEEKTPVIFHISIYTLKTKVALS